MRSSRRVSAALICAATVVLGLAASSTSIAAAATAGPDGLALVQVRHSLLGTHLWYRQTYRGLPVLGGYLAKHLDPAGLVRQDDGRIAVPGTVPTTPIVSASAAGATVAARTVGVAEAPTLAILPGGPARLVWRVVSTTNAGSIETLVDATSGAVVRARSLVKNVDGTGQVFEPNPVVTLSVEALTDRRDANYAALRASYREVTLTNLDPGGLLRGEFASIALGSETARSRTERFVYDRADDRFEQVMAYYHVTRAQLYLQSLGFTDVNNEPQKLLPDAAPFDNSFYDGEHDYILFGTGGVDDAEDAEVIWHELGHAIQDDQVPGFGSTEEAGSIGEGFGDYWAVTMSIPVSDGFHLPCVADWDATSYTPPPFHCLRQTDSNLTVDDVNGEVHHDGQIWSRALWDINLGLGRSEADTIIVEAQFRFTPDTSFAVAAQHTVDVARELYGNAAAQVVKQAFADRGIL